jgi:uncharacterized protein YjaG (DUF416 family)
MDEYRNIIRQKLAFLNDEKKVAFSLLICEKLLQNYTFFSKKYSYGNPIVLNNIIVKLYKKIYLNLEILRELIKENIIDLSLL